MISDDCRLYGGMLEGVFLGLCLLAFSFGGGFGFGDGGGRWEGRCREEGGEEGYITVIANAKAF